MGPPPSTVYRLAVIASKYAPPHFENLSKVRLIPIVQVSPSILPAFWTSSREGSLSASPRLSESLLTSEMILPLTRKLSAARYPRRILLTKSIWLGPVQVTRSASLNFAAMTA